MSQELSSKKIWAKLVSMNPEHKNLVLETEKTQNLFDNQLTISQNQDGEVLIKNISACSIHIDDNIMETNQEKKLFGGERLSFSLQENGQLSAKFDYIFCLVNVQSELKRDRDEVIEPHSLTKLAKDFQKELICSICTNPLQKCMVLTPCQHTFCCSCIFHQLKLSNKCPLCRVEAVSVAKNPLLSNLVQLTVDSSSTSKRLQDGEELEEINFGGMIIRNKEGTYIGSLEKGKRHGQGKIIWKNGDIYEGSWKKGKREGSGRMNLTNGDKYDGSWMNDQFNGIGKYIWEDGAEYEGNFKGDNFNGYGTIKYPDGKIYQGEWKDDKREGNGISTLPNGDKYEGKWVDDAVQPKVKVEYSNGEKYEGEIDVKSFKKQGRGTLILENGDKCQGVWVDGMLQPPQVTIQYANGEKYVGEIEVKNFKKHGKGVFTFKNGDQYDGSWMNDKQHGHGKEICKRIFEGVWNEGKRSGEIIMTDVDGIQYQVELKRLEDQTEKGSLDENKSQTQKSNPKGNLLSK